MSLSQLGRENVRALEGALLGLGVQTFPGTAEKLVRYHEMLCDWNTRMNLTGDTDFDLAIDRHYLDSLAPLGTEGLFPEGASVIDVGSGAGFPGLPLCIARPDMQMTLLDSLAKRVAFLNAVVKDLGLSNVKPLHMRAEDGGQDPGLRERFDRAVARAVAPLGVLCELLLPFVRPGGKMICYKGPAAREEWEAGNRAAAVLGGERLLRTPFLFPRQPDWQHAVFTSEKKEKTVRQYPRKAGTPSRSPLG